MGPNQPSGESLGLSSPVYTFFQFQINFANLSGPQNVYFKYLNQSYLSETYVYMAENRGFQITSVPSTILYH